MNTKLMFSSEKDTWETPQDFFDELDKEFNFELDVCALPSSTKCKEFITPEIDALKQSWVAFNRRNMCWMNPPYGRQIKDWIKKAHNEAQKGATVVALLPARTDTRWFHDYIYNKYEIRFIKGRLKFGDAVNAAPFPSMVVIFKKRNESN